jgi:hypothetical protein
MTEEIIKITPITIKFLIYVYVYELPRGIEPRYSEYKSDASPFMLREQCSSFRAVNILTQKPLESTGDLV